MEYNIGLCCLYNLISVCINLCPCTPIWYTMFFKSIHPFFSIVNRVILIATCKQKMFRSLKKSILFISIPALKYYWMKKLLKIAKSTLQAKCANPNTGPASQRIASTSLQRFSRSRLQGGIQNLRGFLVYSTFKIL